jgi:hypothetical protein
LLLLLLLLLLLPLPLLLLPAPAGLPLAIAAGDCLVVGIRDAGLRTVVDDCEAAWSNFFFRSFTLVLRPAPYPTLDTDADTDADVDLVPPPPSLVSTGFETEREVGRRPLRSAGMAGSFGVVPLPFDRNEEGLCREVGMAEAVESLTRDGMAAALAGCTAAAPKVR